MPLQPLRVEDLQYGKIDNIYGKKLYIEGDKSIGRFDIYVNKGTSDTYELSSGASSTNNYPSGYIGYIKTKEGQHIDIFNIDGLVFYNTIQPGPTQKKINKIATRAQSNTFSAGDKYNEFTEWSKKGTDKQLFYDDSDFGCTGSSCIGFGGSTRRRTRRNKKRRGSHKKRKGSRKMMKR